MRKEYDFSKAERGKFYGKVDIENPIIIEDDDLDGSADDKSARPENDISSDDNGSN